MFGPPLVVPLHYSEFSDGGAGGPPHLFERLGADQRRQLIDVMRFEFDAEILCDLNRVVREEVIACLGFADLAAALCELDSDDAVHLIGHLHEDERTRVLAALPLEDRTITSPRACVLP